MKEKTRDDTIKVLVNTENRADQNVQFNKTKERTWNTIYECYTLK